MPWTRVQAKPPVSDVSAESSVSNVQAESPVSGTPRSFIVNIILLLFGMLAACTMPKPEIQKPIHSLPFDELDLGSLEGHPDWTLAENVFMDRNVQHHCEIIEGKGMIVSQGGEPKLLIGLDEHGDLDLQMDFMLARNSKASILLQSSYSVSLTDSWNQDSVSEKTCGVILDGDSVRLPVLNAAKAPGLWQHLAIKFRAACFDASGKKITNATLAEVMLNGRVIQKDVVLSAAMRIAPLMGEEQYPPLGIASQSGPVAFRNVRYKRYNDQRITFNNIRYAVYKGLYKEYDTLSSMTPLRSGTTDSIHWAVGDKRAEVKFEGELNIPVDGEYVFRLRAGGPAWIILNNNVVTGNRGTRDYTDAHYGSVTLKKGTCSFQVFYANYDESLVVEYEGPGIPLTRLTAPGAERLVRPIEALEYETGNRPGIQRTFFRHRGQVNPYAICVGTPGGLNYAYDLTTYALMDVWSGKFIDVSNMWRSRGESQQALPLGAPLELANIPPVMQLDDPADPWLDTVDVIDNRYEKRGYRIDPSGLPVFMYAYQGLSIEDHMQPEADRSGWNRSIRVKGADVSKNVYYLLGSGKTIEALPKGGYAIDDKEYYITSVKGLDQNDLLVVKKKDRYELILPLKLTGGAMEFSYSIVW